MSESDLLELYPRTPMSSHPVKLPHGISQFDTLEYLRFEAQDLLQLLSHLADRNAESTELVTAREKLSCLMQGWDGVLESLHQDRRDAEAQTARLKQKIEEERQRHEDVRRSLQAKVDQAASSWEEKESALQREIAAIKDHLEEGKEVWAAQMKLIEKSMKDQEASKQKMETRYRDNLAEVERELDEIVHDYKTKKRGGRDRGVGNILPSLFSREELEFEQKKALGEGAEMVFGEVGKIEKLEESDPTGEKWDINLESDESSEVSLALLSPTSRQLYTRLRDLRASVNRYKHEEISDLSDSSSNLSNSESLDKGFIASLPSGLQSITGSIAGLNALLRNLNTDLARAMGNKSFAGTGEQRLEQWDRVEGLAGILFQRKRWEDGTAPGTEGAPAYPLGSLSRDKAFLSHLSKDLLCSPCHDVKLEDLLRLESSQKLSPKSHGGGKFVDTLEMSGIPKMARDEKRSIGSMSGTDLNELVKDAPRRIPEEKTPEQPSAILSDSVSSHRGHDSLLDFFPAPPELKNAPFDVSGVSDVLTWEEAGSKKTPVPKLPLHLLPSQQAAQASTKPAQSPSLDLSGPIAFLQEETPKKKPGTETPLKKFGSQIREPESSINLSIHNESSISQVADSVNTSVGLKMNSFFDLAPPKVTMEEKKQTTSRSRIVPLMPEPPPEEPKSLLARRAKLNESEVQEEQVSILLPKLNATAGEETGYQSQNKLTTSYDENPAFRPRAGPISMQRKLPLLPVKPEAAPGKINRGGIVFRGRPLQPIHPNRIGVSKPASPSILPAAGAESSHPPSDSKFRSESPNLFNKFRIRRFKESERPALKLAQKLPSVAPQRPVAALHPQV